MFSRILDQLIVSVRDQIMLKQSEPNANEYTFFRSRNTKELYF